MSEQLTKDQQIEIDKVNHMSQTAMAKLIRFAPSGHPYFAADLPYHDVFMTRFKSLGGFTPSISKEIGWD